MNKQILLKSLLMLLVGAFSIMAYAETTNSERVNAGNLQVKTIFESDFLDWSAVPSSLTTIPAYTGSEILIDPATNCKVGVPSESDQTGKYKATCIVPYRNKYMALNSGADKYVKIGPIKNLRNFTFIEGNTGNSRGSIVSIIGKGETVETPVLTQSIEKYTGNAQGVKHVLNLADNTTGYTNGDAALAESAFAFTDAQREEAYIIFRNWQGTTDPKKDSYIFYMAIDAEVKITAEQVTVSTAVSPTDAGSIRQNPNGSEFDNGTEITLSATPAFGFQFSKWVDSEGNELSTENPYTFTLNTNSAITAVFIEKNIYSLKVGVAGGANDYLVSVTPKGQTIDGVTFYEEGTEIKLVASNNKLMTFTSWDNGQTEATRTFAINENVELTANYSACEYIVGWDMFRDEPKGQRAADYQFDTANAGMLSLRKADGTTGTWLAKGMTAGQYEGRYAAVNWQPFTTDNNYYYEITFSTIGFRNVKVQAAMLCNYNAFSVQKVQYSVDGGTEYKDLGTYTFEAVKNWYENDFVLPEEAWGVSKVFVRYIPDYTSSLIGTTSNNDGTCITDIFVLADKENIIDEIPPVLLSSIPENNSTGASANGSVILTFDERVQAGTGQCTLNGEPVDALFSGKAAIFKYSGLAYNTTYTFVIPEGAITDMSGNVFAGHQIEFTTMERIQPVMRVYDAVVAADGSGDYTTVIDAVAAAPENRVSPYLIFIKEGTYKGHIEIPANKPYIYFIGQDVEKVIITDDQLCGGDPAVTGKPSLHVSLGATVVVQAANFFAENISFENSWGIEKNDGPQALALYTNNDRIVLNNCKLRSYQDTYLTSTKAVADRHYLKNCFIEGAVDFIYGAGDVYFDECKLYITRKSGGYIVAPSHKADTRWGYVFMNNTISAPAPANETSVWLGRPWKDAPKTVFLNTKAEVTIPAAGWYETMGAIPAIFADYNTMDANGNLIDLSNRIKNYWYWADDSKTNKITGTAKNTLSPEEAAGYTLKNVLSGSDSWQPALMTETVSAPVVSGSGYTVRWDAVPYAICYVVIKNGKVLGFTTETTYTDAQGSINDIYTVQAANEFGGLSAISNEFIAQGPTGIGMTDKANIVIASNTESVSVYGISDAAQIQVFNMSGMLLKTFVTEGDVNFPLAKGNYIVKVVTNEAVKSSVVIVR